MDVKEALQKRRSIRKFTQEAVPEALIEELLHAAMSGPSACNRQPWEFWVVTEPETLEKLRKASRFTNYEAKLAIIVAGNLSRALPMQLSDYWIQDCSAATENILLQATELGLGAVWCGIHPQKRPVERVRELLGMTEKQIPLNIIFLGFPAESPESRDQYQEKNVHWVKQS